jgi:hypothetical protein
LLALSSRAITVVVVDDLLGIAMNRAKAGEFILSVASKSLFALARSAPTIEQWLQRGGAACESSLAKSQKNAKSHKNAKSLSPTDEGVNNAHTHASPETLNEFLASIGFQTLPLSRNVSQRRILSPLASDTMSGNRQPATVAVERTSRVHQEIKWKKEKSRKEPNPTVTERLRMRV